MNLSHDHTISEMALLQVNNPLGDSGDPVLPFVWKQPKQTSIKIQVDDHRSLVDKKNNKIEERVKHSIQMPQFGTMDATAGVPLFAVKHAYDFYQQVKGIEFFDEKKRFDFFANSLLGTAAT